MKLSTIFKLLLAILLVVSLGACTHTTKPEQAAIPIAKIAKPESLLVANFTVNTANVKSDSSILSKLKPQENEATNQSQISNEAIDALATALVKRITEMGFYAQRTDGNQPPTAGSILIAGRFTSIDEGNKARRGLIGLGAGQSSIDTDVQIIAPSATSQQELYAFKAHADSGNKPGAAAGGAASSAAAKLAGVAKSASSAYNSATAQLAAQNADEIADQLSAYFVQQGWVATK